MAKRRDIKEDGMDKISHLPQPILHHILSFLSQKQAVQTCLLSKSWRYLGSTRPLIHFSGLCNSNCSDGDKFCQENCFRGNKKTFLSVLHNTFQRYHDQKIYIHEFCLDMLEVDSESTALLEKWIPMLITPNMVIKTFNLDFDLLFVSSGYFDMPPVIFQLKYLQELELSRCRLNQIDDDKVRLMNLRELILSFVCIDEETLEKIMSSCPLLENVELTWCKGVRTIKLIHQHHNLRDLLVSFRCGKNINQEYDHSIEIDAPNLEYISIDRCSNWHTLQNYLPNLKSLCLEDTRLPTKLFDNFSSNFPCLEKLKLDECYGLEEFQISSRSIKRLIIRNYRRSPIQAAIIDAANILYFKFSGYPPPSPISFTTTSTEWKSLVRLSPYVSSDDIDALSTCFLKINEFLKALSRSQISLEISYGDYFPNPRHIEGGFYEPIIVENLDFGSSVSSPSLPDLLNSSFRICRPRYTNVDGKWKSEINKLLQERVKKAYYFWQQDLEEVTMEIFDENTTEWYPTILPVCKLPNDQKVRFRLKWRDY